MADYFQLTPISRDSCDLDVMQDERTDIEVRNAICSECRQLLPYASIPVFRLERKPDKASLNFIPNTGIFVVAVSLSDIIGNAAPSELETQVLLDLQGREISEYKSFRAKRQAVIRGNKESTSRKCGVCNRLLYFPKGRWYVLQNQVTEGDLFESQFGLIVSETLYGKIVTSTKLRKVCVTKLGVKEVPSDGLGIDPHDRIMEFYTDATGLRRSFLVDKVDKQ